MSKSLKIVMAAIIGVAMVIAIVAGVVNINISEEEQKHNAKIEYTESQVEAEITDESKIENVDEQEIPTVEAVDNGAPVTETEEAEPCPEDEECGRGAAYPKLDVSSPQAFANATIGKCINVDGYYGAQCWDSMSAFWYNYAGRILSTCGSGAAKGTIANGCWQKNAGNEFVMVWDKKNLQAGDIVVFSTGQWGHIGMAMGGYNNGYVSLLGQNQGGGWCPGGGAAGNIINISTRDFIGAFRPKAYIKPEPKPTPKPTPTPAPVADKCKVRTVVKGDTMAKIMKECKGYIKWGSAMSYYASHWYSTKLNKPVTVYYGWTHGTGYGLLAGDVIEYRGE